MGSIIQNTIASFRRMKMALWNIGNLPNHGVYLPFRGYGNTSHKPISSNSKR